MRRADYDIKQNAVNTVEFGICYHTFLKKAATNVTAATIIIHKPLLTNFEKQRRSVVEDFCFCLDNNPFHGKTVHQTKYTHTECYF